MKAMRFHPPGFGGERRSVEEVKRDGWHEQGVLAVALDDERLTWPERELVRQLAISSTASARSRRMAEWTRDMVEERIAEAAAVLKRMPGLRSQGYFSTWPEIQRSRKEIAEGMPRPMRLPPPSTSAITRMEEAITWNQYLERDDANLMWERAGGTPWKHLCHRFGISRPTAIRRWEYALCVIVWRLNGRQVNRKRGRDFLIRRVTG